MTKALELAGQQFGWLTAIKRQSKDDRGRAIWLCRCACGKETLVRAVDLKHGRQQSCGCKRMRPGSGWGGVKKAHPRLSAGRFDLADPNELPDGW